MRPDSLLLFSLSLSLALSVGREVEDEVARIETRRRIGRAGKLEKSDAAAGFMTVVARCCSWNEKPSAGATWAAAGDPSCPSVTAYPVSPADRSERPEE